MHAHTITIIITTTYYTLSTTHYHLPIYYPSAFIFSLFITLLSTVGVTID